MVLGKVLIHDSHVLLKSISFAMLVSELYKL